MRFTPRDYQQLAFDHATRFLTNARPGDRQLYVAPTGSGKSVMMLMVQEWTGDDAWIITPRVEIVNGFLDKLGAPPGVESGLAHRITTPIRFRDTLLHRGQAEARCLIIDEAHHDEAMTWKQIHTLCGHPPAIGFTATAFRGTPKGTTDLLATWGQPQWILTYPEAVERGVIAMPRCSMLPLVDDDLIEMERGELVASRVTSAVKSRVGQIVEFCGRYVTDTWDRPTMFAVSSREVAHALTLALRDAGLHASVVDGETPAAQRESVFAATLAGLTALVQIAVVSEGVDLPIRRLIDLRPTLSPVVWLQQIGRIMRPSSEQPEYVCTNRNLLRHGYLLDGCLPADAIRDAQAAWPGPSKRGAMRVMGLEAVGRFKPSQIPLRDGTLVTTYNVCALDGHQRTDYFAVIHPAKADPVWASAVHGKGPDGRYTWGTWRACEPPTELTGFASTPPRDLTPAQLDWWNKSAERFGLLAGVVPNMQQFQILPVLCAVPEARRLIR